MAAPQSQRTADGNKRTGLYASIVFLRINGIAVEGRPEALEEMRRAVARGELAKPQVAEFFRTDAAEPEED